MKKVIPLVTSWGTPLIVDFSPRGGVHAIRYFPVILPIRAFCDPLRKKMHLKVGRRPMTEIRSDLSNNKGDILNKKREYANHNDFANL